MHTPLDSGQETASAIGGRSTFLFLSKSWIALDVCSRLESVSNVRRHLMHFEALGRTWDDILAWYASEFILLLLSAVSFSINTSKTVPLAVIHAVQMMTPDGLRSSAHSFLLHALPFCHSAPRWSFSHLSISWCSRTVVNSNLVFLNLRPGMDLYLVIRPLFGLRWSLFLMVVFYTNTPSSWRVFFVLWRDFSSPGKRILLTSNQTFAVSQGLPDLWCSWIHWQNNEGITRMTCPITDDLKKNPWEEPEWKTWTHPILGDAG